MFDLPVSAPDIKMNFANDESFTQMREALKNKQNNNTNLSSFSIGNDILMYTQWVPITDYITKTHIAAIPQQTTRTFRKEDLRNRKLQIS